MLPIIDMFLTGRRSLTIESWDSKFDSGLYIANDVEDVLERNKHSLALGRHNRTLLGLHIEMPMRLKETPGISL